MLPRVARGDRKAVEECLDRYGGLVWAMALRWSQNQSDAEDTVQDIFIELWRTSDRFDPEKGTEVTFIATIARRRLIDRRRKRLREAARIAPAGDHDIEQMPGTQHLALEGAGEASMARKALDQLPPDRRRVLQLSIYEGLTHEQISQKTGIPIGTVKSHVRRGLKTVRNFLLGSNEDSQGAGYAS